MAREVFALPQSYVTENYHFADEREQRYLAIGMTRSLLLVVGVVFVDSLRAGRRDHSHHLREKGGGV